MVIWKCRQAADETCFEDKLRVDKCGRIWNRGRRFDCWHERILIPRQDDNVEPNLRAIEPLRKWENGKAEVGIHSLGNLALFAPARAEVDVDDEADADIDSEGDLRFEIGAAAARQTLVVQPLDRAFCLDRDRDGDQAADELGMSLLCEKSRDIELGRVGVNFDPDHVEHADVPDHRQTDHDLRAEAELHVERRPDF